MKKKMLERDREQNGREIDRQRDLYQHRETGRHWNREAERQADGYTDRQRDK